MGGVARYGRLFLALARFPPDRAEGTSCHLSAKGQKGEEPSQSLLIPRDPGRGVESVAVQPRLQTHAGGVGEGIPTPTRPRLEDVLRDLAIVQAKVGDAVDQSEYEEILPSSPP